MLVQWKGQLMALTYFAADGSYGWAAGLVILDTRAWNEEQWDAVENASDRERVAIAINVALAEGDI
jgi:hypothetical protein